MGKLTFSTIVASLVLASGIAMAESELTGDHVTTGDHRVSGDFKAEKRIYQHDGFGAQWALDVGSDGLWFVNKEPIEGLYNAALKIDNNASANALVVGSSVPGKEGNIGIGTDNPSEPVSVERTDAAGSFQLTSITNTANEAAQYILRRARSNSGVASAVMNKDNIGAFSFRGYHGSGYTGSKGMIFVQSTEDWTPSATGTKMAFATTPRGTTKQKTGLEISGNADVFVMNNLSVGKNLYVSSTKMNVPDYVFKKDYKLMPLADLEKFIDQNSHLPGVTSASDVNKAGVVNMTGLQMKLLEKVEELTLYTLQQEKKIAKLEKMQQRVATLESLLTNLALNIEENKKEKVATNLK